MVIAVVLRLLMLLVWLLLLLLQQGDGRGLELATAPESRLRVYSRILLSRWRESTELGGILLQR